jgi:hypothetical protein
MMENRSQQRESAAARAGAAVLKEPAYCGGREQRLAVACNRTGWRFGPWPCRRHSEDRGLASFGGPLGKRQSKRAVVDDVLDEQRARRCGTEESVACLCRDQNAPERQPKSRTTGDGWRIWGGPGSTPSKGMPGLRCMPARPALTAQEQSVKITVDREEGDVSGLKAELLHRGNPRLLTRQHVVNLVRNLILVVELHDAAGVRFLLQRHLRLDVERFFMEAEPGSLSQTIHGWLHEKLHLANCTPCAFSPIGRVGHAHCRLIRAEATGNRDELDQVAQRHRVNMQSVANWVQSGKRWAADSCLGAGMDCESI